ncbi:hypothetical protein T4E_1392 [Trichinella pseudospiralis]|uniref:Uncharacterized protein n=1 Tax=Trichinella pseudospiralis TaxID=6337 RepID=A0A0V0YAT2_TRIPS|nr:hypothetical protein T4E_3594 [Trichinella pseudospiralis]KRX97132.1 hypothetical protein T4E_1392 [Trichinella pseudospiralis]
MNRNTHGEERRQVEKATRSERIAWIESLVGQLRSLVSCVCWSNCDDPGWINTPDPPSTDRSLRSAEDVVSSPEGSLVP